MCVRWWENNTQMTRFDKERPHFTVSVPNTFHIVQEHSLTPKSQHPGDHVFRVWAYFLEKSDSKVGWKTVRWTAIMHDVTQNRVWQLRMRLQLSLITSICFISNGGNAIMVHRGSSVFFLKVIFRPKIFSWTSFIGFVGKSYLRHGYMYAVTITGTLMQVKDFQIILDASQINSLDSRIPITLHHGSVWATQPRVSSFAANASFTTINIISDRVSSKIINRLIKKSTTKSLFM